MTNQPIDRLLLQFRMGSETIRKWNINDILTPVGPIFTNKELATRVILLTQDESF
jgi:hypothetical protein